MPKPLPVPRLYSRLQQLICCDKRWQWNFSILCRDVLVQYWHLWPSLVMLWTAPHCQVLHLQHSQRVTWPFCHFWVGSLTELHFFWPAMFLLGFVSYHECVAFSSKQNIWKNVNITREPGVKQQNTNIHLCVLNWVKTRLFWHHLII